MKMRYAEEAARLVSDLRVLNKRIDKLEAKGQVRLAFKVDFMDGDQIENWHQDVITKITAVALEEIKRARYYAIERLKSIGVEYEN